MQANRDQQRESNHAVYMFNTRKQIEEMNAAMEKRELRFDSNFKIKTMTMFNLLLAKRENRLGYIFDIIVRNRCKQNAWSSDSSKLYNQLHLDISALPYFLFLFHSSQDPNVEPEV